MTKREREREIRDLERRIEKAEFDLLPLYRRLQALRDQQAKRKPALPERAEEEKP